MGPPALSIGCKSRVAPVVRTRRRGEHRAMPTTRRALPAALVPLPLLALPAGAPAQPNRDQAAAYRVQPNPDNQPGARTTGTGGQDLRSPDAVDAGRQRLKPSRDNRTTGTGGQDLRSPDAVDASRTPGNGPGATPTAHASADPANWPSIPLAGAALLAAAGGIVRVHARRTARVAA